MKQQVLHIAESFEVDSRTTMLEREISAALRAGGMRHGLPEAVGVIEECKESAAYGFEEMLDLAITYTDEHTVTQIQNLIHKKFGQVDPDENGEYARMKSLLTERFSSALLALDEDRLVFSQSPDPELEISNVTPVSELVGDVDASPSVYVVSLNATGEKKTQYAMGEIDGLLVCGCPDKSYRYSAGVRRCKHEIAADVSSVSPFAL